MKEEIETHPREPEQDAEQRRTTERGRDPGTSEPGTPTRDAETERSATERSQRIGPPGTTRVGEGLKGAPTEDSPAREPTERIEKMREATRDTDERER